MTLLSAVSVLGGCVYLNSFYNARQAFDQAERTRWAGRGDEARMGYDSVVVKAARSYREDPEGSWADDALYLLGKAYLRLGHLADASAALQAALEKTDDDELRSGILLYLGMVTASMGDHARATALLNESLRGVTSDRLLGEGHLWRARILLESGETDAGWWDLNRAVEADERYEVPAGLERLGWGIREGDTTRVRQGLRTLMHSSEGYLREDTLLALIGETSRRWGGEVAAEALSGVEDANWPRDVRERMLLERARLRIEGGDTVAGLSDATAVAGGVGPEAVRARLMLARLVLGGVTEVAGLAAARRLLLPAVGDARVLQLLEFVRLVELLSARAADGEQLEAWFAAAEVARDDLGSPDLARNLFLQYAEEARTEWAGKAVLAALELARAPGERPPILRRMARLRNNPYVLAGDRRGAFSAELQELDDQLQERLSAALEAATARAVEIDVLVRERSDTTGWVGL